MVKTTGAEWNRYYSDPLLWDNGQWHDDVVITVDGVEEEEYETLPDTAIVGIDGGIVFGTGCEDDKAPSMELHFKRWKKQQTMDVLAVECPKEKTEAVKQAIRNAGGKVL